MPLVYPLSFFLCFLVLVLPQDVGTYYEWLPPATGCVGNATNVVSFTSGLCYQVSGGSPLFNKFYCGSTVEVRLCAATCESSDDCIVTAHATTTCTKFGDKFVQATCEPLHAGPDVLLKLDRFFFESIPEFMLQQVGPVNMWTWFAMIAGVLVICALLICSACCRSSTGCAKESE